MKKIYVLEDESSIREVLEVFLTIEGYDVRCSGIVSEFYSTYYKERTDLFMLDVRRPDGSGTEVCEILKKSLETKDIPVIMMSANTQLQDIRSNLGPEAFIANPFDLEKVLQTISELTGRESFG
ncbi:MAG: response regulator [Chryseobacterium sp.]|nr:response regulator [Chryseobacterium sp.]